jgi:hypothetical protein
VLAYQAMTAVARNAGPLLILILINGRVLAALGQPRLVCGRLRTTYRQQFATAFPHLWSTAWRTALH